MSQPGDPPLHGGPARPGAGTSDAEPPARARGRWWPVATAGIVAFAAVFRLTALHAIGSRNVYLTFFPAVVLAALYGGLWAGLLATALCALAADYFLIDPPGFGGMPLADWIGMGVFLIAGAMIAGVTEAMHRARVRARAAAIEARHAVRAARQEEALRTLNAELAAANTRLTSHVAGLHEANERVLAANREAAKAGAELQRVNRALKALSDSNQALTRAAGETEYLQEVCRIVQRDCGYAMIWIGHAADDPARSVQPVAQAGFDEGYLQTLNLTWADTERGRGPTGTAIRTGRPAGCRNLRTDPAFAPWREEACRRGFGSSLAVPVIAGGRAIGAITVYSCEPGAFSTDEEGLLGELAGDVSSGITALRLRAAHAADEQALRAERDAVRDREEELNAIYENAPLIMLLVDGDHRIQKANRQAVAAAGAGAGGLLGRRAGEALHCAHLRDDPRGCGFGPACAHCSLRHAVTATIDSGRGHQQLEVAMMSGPAEAARTNTYLLSTRRLNVRGAPRALVTMQDITSRKQAEEALQRARAELELRVADRTARLRALASELTLTEERERRRIAQVLHDDLQQLLVGARLRLEAVRGRTEARPLADDLERIERLLGESGDVARDLSHELSPTVLHEHGLAAGLRWLGRWMLEQHGLDVQVDAADAAEALAPDVKVLVYQAVRELLFNVVKHAGVRAARVTVAPPAGGLVEVVVSDAGKGFAAPAPAEPAPGGGFGLFSIRERLALFGGRLETGNGANGGSRCRLILPLAGRARDPMPPGSLPRPAAGPRGQPAPRAETRGAHRPAAPPRESIRVLLADDHNILRDGLAVVLNTQPGIEVVGFAADGEEAVALAASLQPQVVVMDVSMPRLDGIAATRQIAAACPQIKVIGLTMHADEDSREAMRAAGAVECLVKTGPTEDLVAAICAATGTAPPRPPAAA